MDAIFSYYDNLIAPLSTGSQALISLFLLLFLVFQIYLIIKSGHWLFVAALIVFLPGTWPATRLLGQFILDIFSFLFTRAQSILIK